MALVHGGVLLGHRGWVTCLACPSNESEVKLVSGSRDKTIVAWKEQTGSHIPMMPSAAAVEGKDGAAADGLLSNVGALYVPLKRLEGHSDFISDISLSNAGDFVLSGSWDKSARLWNVKTGECQKNKFLGHEKDICSVAFSPDNTQIVTVGRDCTMRIWDVKAQCLGNIQKDMHTDWINSVRFSPTIQLQSSLVTGSSDGTVKVWDREFAHRFTLKGHSAAVNTVTVSPDGSLCASAGKDGKTKLWDLVRGEHLYELDCKEPVNQICFSPNRYWLCAASDSCAQVFDLESKDSIISLAPESKPEVKSKPRCISLCWSLDGSILFTGYTDGSIHWWNVTPDTQ